MIGRTLTAQEAVALLDRLGSAHHVTASTMARQERPGAAGQPWKLLGERRARRG